MMPSYRSDSEMPECLLGCGQLNRPDKSVAPNWRDLQLLRQTTLAVTKNPEKTKDIAGSSAIHVAAHVVDDVKIDSAGARDSNPKGNLSLGRHKIDLWELLNNSSSEEEE